MSQTDCTECSQVVVIIPQLRLTLSLQKVNRVEERNPQVSPRGKQESDCPPPLSDIHEVSVVSARAGSQTPLSPLSYVRVILLGSSEGLDPLQNQTPSENHRQVTHGTRQHPPAGLVSLPVRQGDRGPGAVDPQNRGRS